VKPFLTPYMVTEARPGNLELAGFLLHIDGDLGERDKLPELTAEELEGLEELLGRLLEGRLRRWHLDLGSGGCAFDAPAEWDELRLEHELIAAGAYPGRKWTLRESELPSGSFGWVHYWHGLGAFLIAWPTPAKQLSLFEEVLS